MVKVKTAADWYELGCDYTEGVHLLRHYGRSIAQFESYLKGGYISDYIRDSLKNEIDKLPILEENDKTQTIYRDAQTHLDIENDSRNRPQNDAKTQEPHEISLLREEARRLHKQEAVLHEQLHAATDKETRGNIAREKICVVAPRLDAIYDKIREWETTGNVQKSEPKKLFGDAESLKTEKEKINDLWLEKLSIEPRLSKIKKNAACKDEIIEKFERLKLIHEKLELNFRKNINDYI